MNAYAKTFSNDSQNFYMCASEIFSVVTVLKFTEKFALLLRATG